MNPRQGEPDDDAGFFDIELDAAPEQATAIAAPAPDVEHRAPTAGAVVADRLIYRRAGRTVLDGVSLQVQPGESVAVVGPSGSGKSSLLALLAGLERPDGGTVTRERSQAGVGLILQGYGLVSVLTAAENVEAPLQAGVLGKLSRREIRARSAEILAAVGLDHVADHLIEELSGGQQQRVAVARALAVDPSIVFADELTAELDHDWKNRMVDLVLAVAERGGIVVIATHDMELAGRCDRILRITDGRLAA